MTDVTTQDGAAPKRIRKPPDDAVSGYKLAIHLGVTRQYIDALAAQGVLTRRPDGMFDQTTARLGFIKHLRKPRSSR